MSNKRQRKRAHRGRYVRRTSTSASLAHQTSRPAVPAEPLHAGAGSVRIGRRGILFAALCALCLLVAGGAVAWELVRDDSRGTLAAGGPMDDSGAPGTIARISQPAGAVVFRNVYPGDHRNQVGLVPLGQPDSGRQMVPLRCLRVHFAADRGLCLAEGNGPPGTYSAYILDADLRETGEVQLGGLPSRTRVSPDARYGATTAFVTGHSYAEDSFSTETLLLDLGSGKELGNLEDFTAFRDGQEFANEDFNFWGVTFTQDSNRFYATLSTGGKTYLVQGDISARKVDVLRENVECPSISPDNTRIAYKKRVGGDLSGPVWRFHVLDLATMTETPLAETRSIDDQIMWLDNEQVLYDDGSDTWVMSADGGGQPQRFMSKAVSAAVLPGTGESTGAVPADSAASNQSNEGDVLTLPETDLGISIDMPDTASTGAELAYTITVTNNGPNEATWLLLDHYLPAGATFGAATLLHPPGNSYGCSNYQEENRIRCDTASLPSGGNWSISVTVTPSKAGQGTLRANVGAAVNDPNPTNDSAEGNVTIEP